MPQGRTGMKQNKVKDMPELPEVETVKNSLKDLIIGKKIINVKVYYDKMIQNVSSSDFEKKLQNEAFIDIKRQGKYLIFILEHYIMLSHLRMEGKYFLNSENKPKGKHEHIIFNFANGETLRYSDTRKFGVVYLFEGTDITEVQKQEPLCKLGIEPISVNLSVSYLKNKMGKKNLSIKTVLLDQTIISGLGNIYADEVCFMSHLNPNEKAKNLTDTDFENIIESSKTVLEKAIKLGGTTIRSFMSSHEITGKFQNELLVHTKEKCPECQNKIKKIYVNGRGTYYCPKCQSIRKRVVGITGGIACGKSTITNYLLKRGYKVISSDEIVHRLLENDEGIKKQIVKEFTEEVLENNNISRTKLGKIVFNNLEAKKTLEDIIHPKVKEKIKDFINQNEGIIFIEVPLLFEAKMSKMFDKTICISSNKEKQIERLKQRNNLDKEEALKRINSQLKLTEKEKLADYVIYNNDSFEDTYHEIDSLLERII